MTKLNVPDMSCNHCTAAIEKAVKAADASAVLRFDLEAHIVDVTSQLNAEALAKILNDEGYPSTLAS